MMIDLVASHGRSETSLANYIRCMLRVMRFDASRRGRTISRCELAAYTRDLAAGVMFALESFLGPEDRSTVVPARLAVAGAHIAHMLRDTKEDLRLGYFNVPSEVLAVSSLQPDQIDTPAYGAWVRRRVHLARRSIRLGTPHLLAADHFRFRLATLIYVLRFETLLDAIEERNFRVDRAFPPSGKAQAAGLAARAFLQAHPAAQDIRRILGRSHFHPSPEGLR